MWRCPLDLTTPLLPCCLRPSPHFGLAPSRPPASRLLQMRSLQLSLEAMEEALDGADVGKTLAALQVGDGGGGRRSWLLGLRSAHRERGRCFACLHAQC